MASEPAVARSVDRREVRRVRRVSQPAPWWPWGVLWLVGIGLVLLFGMVPFAWGWIQATAERTARQALADVGADWATPTVSGQWVTLKGTAPSEEAGSRAVNAVLSATAPTLLGPLAPVTHVTPAYTVASAVAPAAVPDHEWAFTVHEGVLELEGEVPDEATRRALELAAREAIAPPGITEVDNALVVRPGDAPEGFAALAQRGLSNVVQCDRGVAELSCGRYALLCELPEARAAEVEAAATASVPYGRLGRIQVLANEAVASCEQGLAEVLGRSTIRFDSSSDAIDESSATVLDEVATGAQACPGTLRIEGHTDNTGTPGFNDDLSRRRAAAVLDALVARGLPRERLIARGFGARRPVASNTSSNGRARNRRIEIRVVRARE